MKMQRIELIPNSICRRSRLKNCDLEIAITVRQIDIVQIKEGREPFIFTAEVAVKPEVTLGEYKGMEVDKTSTRCNTRKK